MLTKVAITLVGMDLVGVEPAKVAKVSMAKAAKAGKEATKRMVDPLTLINQMGNHTVIARVERGIRMWQNLLQMIKYQLRSIATSHHHSYH